MIKKIKSLIKAKVLQSVGMAYNDADVSYVLAKHLARKRDIVLVDVGAHTGDFTRSIDRLCGVRQGALFEPQPSHAEQMRRSFDAKRFEIHECVVSNFIGSKMLEINEFDATSSTLPTLRDSPDLAAINVQLQKALECKSTTLDASLDEERFNHIDLLKIDVQGAELQVIQGAKSVLARTKLAWIEISYKPLYQGACLFHEVYDAMSQHGLHLVELETGFRSPRGELVQGDALFCKI